MSELSGNTIRFTGDDGEAVSLEVLEETRINGVNYLLVADGEEAYIFKEVSDAQEEEAAYVPLEDEREIEYISGIFSELLEDVDLT